MNLKKNIEAAYPLSPMQQGMLFHTLYASESGVYFEQLSCTLHGDLNVLAFQRAWQQVVDRHQILRTAFVWDNIEKPLQVVGWRVRLPWEQHDWRGLSAVEQQEQLKAFLQADQERGFQLSKAPLMRLALIQVDEDTYKFVWSYHHLLLDGWSRPLVIKEVFAFYEAFCRGQDLHLERSRPYQDYIAWLQQQDLAQAEVFWRQALKGFTAPTPLGFDRALASLSSKGESYDEQQLQLSVAVTATLQSFARQHQLTLNTLVQGAWALLLSRYSGEVDVVFGTTVSGRPAALTGVESMVGLFINTLPMRVSVPPAADLLSWFKQIQNQQVELRQYEYSPLLQVQGWSEVPRGLPLFESIVVFENYPVDASLRSQRSSLEIRNVSGVERTNYPLTMVAAPGSQLSLQLSYDCRRFDAAIITRMLGHFQTLLEGIVADPWQRLKDLPLLTQPERQQLLVEWNDTSVDYPKDVCIHQLFEAQVERTPDAVAVVFESEQLTYRELNRRANQVAHYLHALGVVADGLVGICLERSLEMVVGLLGILKAGGAYVPLDPAYPQERLAFMLSDTQAPVLLTQQRLVEKLPSHQARVVCLDTDLEAIAKQSDENPASGVTPDHLAYVMYTSGSTGRPKGVSAIHRGVVRLVKGTNYANLSAEEVLLQLAPISFDASIFEIWGCLLNGARLVVMPAHMPSLKELGQALGQYQVTTLWLTAGLFHLMVDERLEDLKPVRQLLAGGDVLSVSHVQKVNQELKGCRLINGYGPTESTTFTCCYPITEPSQVGISVSIGRPIANTQVYLLDGKLQPVPVGIPGELYIGGDGLARDYLNRPELTAERFIPNCFSNEPGARLYKTGDLARYLNDGNIEYLGRIDDQVKIRGFRIELGEIEAVLGRHPAVQETVVIAREDVPGNKRLVAYVVVNQAPAPTIQELHQFLKRQLPEYMVPSAFVLLEVLPLTPNGKVDRRALPAPDTARPEGSGAYLAPRTPVEEVLVGIWAAVLGLQQVGIHDNFFELGGHSLLATQLLSRLRDTFSVELPLRGVFEALTVAGLAERLEAARLSEQGLQLPPLLPVARSGSLPLSFAQARLWFLEQFQPGSLAYNIPAAVRLRGALDVGALEQSLNEITRRHEALRTTFATVKGQPQQVIAPGLDLTLPVVKLGELPAAQQEAEVQRLVTQEAMQPFDLSHGPLLRATLLQLGEVEHVLLLTMHHIVSDGWSLGVFIRELAALYSAFSTGKPSPLADLPIQYVDFAHWQRQWLQGEVLATQLTYWQQQLAGVPPVLDLPTDRPRPAVQTFSGASQSLELPLALSQSLKALSQRCRVTLFMTLLAAFQVLLYRYSGQSDICVGSPIANRNRSETEHLIGFFVNTLVLRTNLSGHPSFQKLLGRVREVALGAYAHQDLPFEQLVEALQPERNLSHQPLFQVMFVLQNAPMPALELPGLTLSSLEMDSATAKFDLTLSMVDSSQGLVGALEYNTDLFDATTITRMLGHFQTLLEGIVAHPEQPISDLPLLTERERQQLLVEWNNTQVDYPKDLCIQQLFEAQVERTPDTLAVVFESQQLTYRELNHRANQVAHHLLSLGVEPDGLVGICLERSLEMVVGLLGILKAGGAYVPLDPAYPQERLAFMLADAQVPVLLTQEKLVGGLPDLTALGQQDSQIPNPIVVCLDTDWEVIARQSKDNPVSEVTTEHLAYVIYTSGSTGKPKGVSVSHRAVNRLVLNTNYVKLEPSDRVAQASNCSFDAATFEIWGALLQGARLVGITKDVALSPQNFAAQTREQEISALFLTTALFNQLAREVPWAFHSVRHLLFGGEAIDPRWVKEVLKNRPPKRLLHVYGPTESTTFTSWHLVQDVPEGATTIPIGRPIANTEIYLLDDQLQPVPIGVPGELYIGGDGLARDYLNRPELTAERFIPNCFSNKPGAHLYKTSDLARYLSDGNIEYLGRIDQQVKIRGFRIELGEIEAVLSRHSAVQETVVIAREDVPGNKRLVAYVVTNQVPAPAMQELHQFLKQQLPEYMVPTAFVLLEALPLTPNGKVDRRALPAPDTTRPEWSGAYLAPRTPVEEVLAGIWADILGIQQVGIHDNFFELGGHSLLATQLLSRLRDTFSVELPLRGIFEAPTVAGLAERLEATRLSEQGLQLPPLLAVARSGSLPLSFAQARLWFLEQFQPGSLAYNIPAAVLLKGALHVGALEQSLNEITRRHEALRTTFATVEGRPVQAIAASLDLSLPVVELGELPAAQQSTEVQRLATQEAMQPFDLSHGPLLRATLLQLGEVEHVLLLTMHHIVSDGWSLGVLIRELAALYSAFSTGQPSPLPELPIQYADFAHWQRQWLQGEVLALQLTYWQQQLAGAPPVLELPTDRPRPAVQTFSGTSQSLALPKSLSQSLLVLSQQSGVTLFMTLLAAFQVLLYRYSGQSDICVGSPIANRNRSETEGLIGFFVNTLVLRTNLSGDLNFQELLGRVREVALGAYAHQDLPFEQLVEALQPERNLSHQPLFQVMFALQNAPMPALELPGLTLSSLEMDSTTAKFDLTLVMQDSSQGLVGSLEYNTDLFDATTITRMLGHFQTLLEGIVADPSQRLKDLPLLTQPERQQLLLEWNHTQVNYPKDVCIHKLFEAQVEQTPDAIAMVFEEQQLTYQELNRRANQVAHHLQSLGVEPDTLVGICLERSLEMVVGLLGILKAGGAYVPLDPAYPQERLAWMLEDAQALVLLTQAQLVEKLPSHQARVVCLDTSWEVIAKQSESNPVSGVTANNLAYVIYTSGSTGRPKGVQIQHAGLVNLATWHQRVYSVTPADRATQLAGPAFDASVWELWPYLTAGASIHIPAQDIRLSPSSLLEWLNAEAITIGFMPTPLAAAVLEEQWPTGLALRVLLTGGDKLHREPRKASTFSLVNHYGPTENTVVTTCAPVAAATGTAAPPPIGRPIANTQVYLLDAALQPVPAGVPGELYIGGAGLARGYLNRPELTAEKFIPNCFSNEPGARLYKTGDLARYLSDGNIEYVGRLDDQVKIRGFRIELGEIEAVLGQHPALQESVVIAREDVPGNKRLVAYVVANQAPAPTISELQQFLKEKLPEYMVPSAIVLLEALPLTPNGKVDRRVLPAPDSSRSGLEAGFVAPRTRTEEILAAIWAKVLGLEQIGIHDNFFELGGDSIISIQIIARANQAGLQITPRQLFQHQTIAELANVVSTTKAIQAEQGLVTGPVPLTPIQHWFFERNLPEPHHFNQSILLEAPPDLKPELLERVVQQLLMHHDALRLQFVPSASGWQQVNVGLGETVPFTFVDLSPLSSDEQQLALKAAATELQASLSLSEGRLIRVALFNLGIDKPGRLLLVIHHLAVDGVSWRILLEDLSTSYQQLSQGKAIQLPPKTTSFKDWAYRLSEYGQSEALAAELDYWLVQSRGVSPLPVDYPSGRQGNTVASAAKVSVSLSVEQTRTLLQKVPPVYNTQINDVLLTALVETFAQWTGKRSLLFELEGHGREKLFEDVDLSRTVGWFTTILPVLLELGEVTHPGEALKSVKEQLRHLPNRGISYGLLRYLSQDAATRLKLQALPPAEVSFNYLGQLDQVLSETSTFGSAKESSGPARSQLGTRSHLLEVNAFVAMGQLRLDWMYSQNVHQQATVEGLAQGFVEALRSLIAHCQSPEAGGYTPSDFPDITLSSEKLDKVLAEIDLDSMED